MSLRVGSAALAVVALAGCEGVLPAPDWEQMIDQHKLRPFEASALFVDGRAMRPPPPGTVPRTALVGQAAFAQGRTATGGYVERIPVPLDRAALERGRATFETWCAACHGMTGDGDSVVARHMELRRPPSLVAAPVVQFPVGRIFVVVDEGYGLMPSYRQQLSAAERWEVVGYLGALQLSQSAHLDALPADVRSTAERALADDATGAP